MKSEERREGLGSAKRFGTRYGRKTKLKFSKVETEQRKLHKCPYCSKVAVKRVALGIWQCRKCEAKFTGKAYSVTRKIVTKEAEEELEEPQAAEEQAGEAEVDE
ncbi:50S ribosomal protein L37ae [Candidatus Woesearchaeota archaeon]|nr:50S ribosomal protein L37ae [Candidatus Woesearchaeota archaeon]